MLKYGVFFVFIQSIVAVQPVHNSEDEYFKYVDGYGLPRILIVGSGRGTLCEQPEYASAAYGDMQKNYLLVNIDPKSKPDVECDILQIGNKFKEEQYDYIIFENVDYHHSFNRKAIKGAIRLLKPGGFLVSSPILGTFHQYFKEPLPTDWERFQIGDGILFYKENPKTLENDGLHYILWPNDNYPENKIKLLNDNKDNLKKCFGIDTKDDIKFVMEERGSKLWPRRGVNKFASKIDLMVIQKH
ncbi:MAG: methyltransferase domain-containing protein [Holosporaceae bacterium]|jgi:SAM-dependent methyltransferase|nr:methyltransferase domain-containing protein [Holosporaceae bacterium]